MKEEEKTPEEQDNIKKDILPVSGAGQWGTDELTDNYLKDTPGQSRKYMTFKQYNEKK